MDKKLVLHVGCGTTPLPVFMRHVQEVRLDVDPAVKPDIVADMAHLPEGIGPFDAIFSCHSLEHLYPHDVVPCLEGFRRVLKPGGVVIVHVPDLEGVAATDEVLFISQAGPITGLDMIYGLRTALKDCPPMSHHCGFVADTLRDVLEGAGFVNVKVERMTGEFRFNLLATGEAPK